MSARPIEDGMGDKPRPLDPAPKSTALIELRDSAGRRVRAYAVGADVVFRVGYQTRLGQLDKQSDDYAYEREWRREAGRQFRIFSWRTVQRLPLRILQTANQYGTAIGLEERGRGQRPYISGRDVATLLVAWDRRVEGCVGPLEVRP